MIEDALRAFDARRARWAHHMFVAATEANPGSTEGQEMTEAAYSFTRVSRSLSKGLKSRTSTAELIEAADMALAYAPRIRRAIETLQSATAKRERVVLSPEGTSDQQDQVRSPALPAARVEPSEVFYHVDRPMIFAARAAGEVRLFTIIETDDAGAATFLVSSPPAPTLAAMGANALPVRDVQMYGPHFRAREVADQRMTFEELRSGDLADAVLARPGTLVSEEDETSPSTGRSLSFWAEQLYCLERILEARANYALAPNDAASDEGTSPCS